MPARSAELLSAEGPFGALLPGFQPRSGQQEMAAVVEAALARGGTYLLESGTGTGKTFAYLVPALLSRRRVLISTGTRHLQDQLFHRDLPLVRTALGVHPHCALLKGRGNYLCLHRLARAGAEAGPGLDRVRRWAETTRGGDVAELEGVPEDDPVWPQVTSTSDNCLGRRCEHFDHCHVYRARQQALQADLVVVNHHLFFADLALREDGFGELLPGVEGVIFDEAHQLPEVASDFFGTTLGRGQLTALARDLRLVLAREKLKAAGPAARVDALERLAADLRLALGRAPGRLPWEAAAARPPVRRALDDLRRGLAALAEDLAGLAGRSEDLDHCARRAGDYLGRLQEIDGDGRGAAVAWVEVTAQGFVLRRTPVDVAGAYQARLGEAAGKTWIYTSATLAVGGDFDFFRRRLGLEEADAHAWPSPYDYQRQALLYIPPGLPEPASPDCHAALLEAVVPVLEASGGRAFFLFTSHRALARMAEDLPDRIPYPVLVQGSQPRGRLLEAFRRQGDAVLLGTGSFWEGVDVAGPVLSCVIIDKLPFATPGDPVLQARARALEAEGGNPFWTLQLPAAVLSLKQGAGRLIRGDDDRGVLVLCDPRLLSRSYGRRFLDSLPPMPLTRDIQRVRAFFAAAPHREAGP